MEFDPARIPARLASSRNPLRVAIVTETYPPEINGVARTVAQVVEGLLRRGHEVQLIRPQNEASPIHQPIPQLREILTRGCPIPRYPELKLGFPAGRQLSRLWRTAPPHVVHLATEGPLGASALLTARRLGLPTVSEFRTNFDAYTRYYGIGCLQRLIRGYLRAFHNRTGLTMVPTSLLAKELNQRGFVNLTTVARGVDASQFHPSYRSNTLRETWDANPKSLVALSVGRLAPEKNLDLVHTAFLTMRHIHPDTRLVFVGDGPSKTQLQSQCTHARFAGMRSGSDLAAHYASADLLLFPSITETFGNVTLEAMASGLPVLAYDYAAASQLIRHGESGLLARLNDPTHFTALAASVARQPTLLPTLGQRARQRAESMDWNVILDQIETHYHNTIRQKLGVPLSSTPPRSISTPQPLIDSRVQHLS